MDVKQLDYMIPILKREVENHDVEGVRASVLYRGEEVFSYHAGYADVDRKTPMEEDTIVRLFSMSKPITAVAALILYERGQLDMFAPVSSYIDGFMDQKVYTPEGLVDAKRPVLIKDLFNMTSPILYPDSTPGNEIGNRVDAYYEKIKAEMREGKETTTMDFVKGLSRIPLAFQPGEYWQYSASADILGAVIEAISGKRFGEFLKEELFAPLGMEDTAFYVPEEKVERFAEAFRYNASKQQNERYRDNHLCVGDWLSDPLFESGGAGLVSTMKDYKRFVMMLLQKGKWNGKRILGEKTIEFLASDQLSKEQKKMMDWESMWGYGYGNLVRVLIDPVAGASNGSIGEYGWDGWMGCYFCIDPKDDMAFLYFVQEADGCNVMSDRRKLRQIIYGSL